MKKNKINKLGFYDLNTIHNVDNLIALNSMPDKSIDLIITDPPYGIGADNWTTSYGDASGNQYAGNWDQVPSQETFNEILRVGKKVLIFGGNYFTHLLPQSSHWIVWDKVGEMKVNSPFSKAELIWTNINTRVNVDKFYIRKYGFINDGDVIFHPTQKPLRLMQDLISAYAAEGDIIADFYSGSGVLCKAAKELGFKFIGFETDPEFYKKSLDYLNGIEANGQTSIFTDFENTITL